MGEKRSGVSYKCVGIIVVGVLVLSTAICAAIVVPLFMNREGTSAKVDIPKTSTAFTTAATVVETEAETDCGKIKGLREDDIYVFKGIPYSQPPMGALRWKPPKPISPENGNCWNETYNANSFGNVCPQFFGSYLFGEEDCLYLNVWTPKVDNSAQLPVMVYIHGGSLQSMSGNTQNQSPTARLASDTQTVYVSFNYRLNVFGFLALDLLTSNSSTNSSGNYGFMDQLLVLNWVRRNIRNFGGNPSLVTIFGESSGGTSVMALLASPLSQDLFHRAWMMSASVVLNRTLSQASTDNLIFLDNTNCTDLECLYSLPVDILMHAIPMNVWPRWSLDDLNYIPTKGLFNGAIAINDGFVLKDDPLEAFRSGRGMQVPVMIGTMAQETDMEEPAPNVRSWTWDNYTDYLTMTLKPFGDNILNRALELYPQRNDVTPEFQLSSLSTDIRVTCPNDFLANALASSSELRAFRYIVTSHPPTPTESSDLPFLPKYAFHAWDSLVLFGGLSSYPFEPTPENFDFKRIQEQEMLHFARNGFPYSLTWRSYPETTAIISSTLVANTTYHYEECRFWLDNGFFSYGWIN